MLSHFASPSRGGRPVRLSVSLSFFLLLLIVLRQCVELMDPSASACQALRLKVYHHVGQALTAFLFFL